MLVGFLSLTALLYQAWQRGLFSACYGRQSYFRTSAVCSSGFTALTVAGRNLSFSVGWGTSMSNGNVSTVPSFSLWVARIDTRSLNEGGGGKHKELNSLISLPS